jgi:hypothetical protein
MSLTIAHSIFKLNIIANRENQSLRLALLEKINTSPLVSIVFPQFS